MILLSWVASNDKVVKEVCRASAAYSSWVNHKGRVIGRFSFSRKSRLFGLEFLSGEKLFHLFTHPAALPGLRWPTGKVSFYGPGTGKDNGKRANETCNSIRQFPRRTIFWDVPVHSGNFPVGRTEKCFPFTSQRNFRNLWLNLKRPPFVAYDSPAIIPPWSRNDDDGNLLMKCVYLGNTSCNIDDHEIPKSLHISFSHFVKSAVKCRSLEYKNYSLGFLQISFFGWPCCRPAVINAVICYAVEITLPPTFVIVTCYVFSLEKLIK